MQIAESLRISRLPSPLFGVRRYVPWAVAAVVLVTVALGIFMPAVGNGKPGPLSIELSHLWNLTIAAIMFADEHQGRLPTTEDWDSQLVAYIGDRTVLTSPLSPNGGRAFAFNKHLSQLSLADLPDPSRTVLLFECVPGGPLSGGSSELPSKPRYKGGYLISFADGSRRVVPMDDVTALVWKPQSTD